MTTRREQNRAAQAAYRARHAKALQQSRRVGYTLTALRRTSKAVGQAAQDLELSQRVAAVARALRECLSPAETALLVDFMGRSAADLRRHIKQMEAASTMAPAGAGEREPGRRAADDWRKRLDAQMEDKVTQRRRRLERIAEKERGK